MDALQELLDERAYAEIGISEIARRAGLTTGALYARFGDKHGLAMALHERFAQHSLEAINAWASRPEWAAATSRDIVANWARGAVNFCRMYRPLLSVMMNDPAVRESYDELIAVPAEHLARLVGEAVTRHPELGIKSGEGFRRDVEWAGRAAIAVLERFELDDEIESRIDTMLRRLIGIEAG